MAAWADLEFDSIGELAGECLMFRSLGAVGAEDQEALPGGVATPDTELAEEEPQMALLERNRMVKSHNQGPGL